MICEAEKAGTICKLVGNSISEEVKIRDRVLVYKMRLLEPMSFKPPNPNTEVLVLNEAPQFRPETSEEARGTMSLKTLSDNEGISDDINRGRMQQKRQRTTIANSSERGTV